MGHLRVREALKLIEYYTRYPSAETRNKIKNFFLDLPDETFEHITRCASIYNVLFSILDDDWLTKLSKRKIGLWEFVSIPYNRDDTSYVSYIYSLVRGDAISLNMFLGYIYYTGSSPEIADLMLENLNRNSSIGINHVFDPNDYMNLRPGEGRIEKVNFLSWSVLNNVGLYWFAYFLSKGCDSSNISYFLERIAPEYGGDGDLYQELLKF